MPADTRFAALVFVVPFTVAVCIVAFEAELASGATFTGLLVLSRNSASPEESPEDSNDR